VQRRGPSPVPSPTSRGREERLEECGPSRSVHQSVHPMAYQAILRRSGGPALQVPGRPLSRMRLDASGPPAGKYALLKVMANTGHG